jgi:AAA15 family ATPase/GTPase
MHGLLLEEEVIFNLSEESSGTQKLIVLTALILPTLAQGDLLIVDELNKDLHPLLTRMLIELFQQDSTNANAAQMICATHDATLLDKKLFRRDQIYLVNKSNAGMSTLGRLSDFKGISKLIPLDKWYLEGLFKGTPAINKYQIKTETQ